MTQVEQDWTGGDADQALAQGWGIFETSREAESEEGIVNGKAYGHRPYELQRDDEGDLANDDQAHKLVREAVQKGDPLALKAKAFLLKHSPVEHDTIFV